MNGAVYAGFERVLPGELDAFRLDLKALQGFAGIVFLDPEDGLNPFFLAGMVRRVQPEARVVLPLVARDMNRQALLGAARTAEALGANALLLLSGRLDPAYPGRTVYELDPLQMLGFLEEHRISLAAWVSSRCHTAAERARVRSFARAGASSCLIPWSPEDPPAAPEALAPILAVTEADWVAGRLPGAEADVVLHVAPGRAGAAAAAWREGRS